MRTLSANLTTAQKGSPRTPYITINTRSFDGDTTETFATTDSPNKILEVKQAEGRFGGDLVIPGTGEPISAIIKLRDADGTLEDTDRVGYRVDIGWGLNTAGGNEASEGEPLFVVRQRSLAREGELILELYCFSLWDLLKHRNSGVLVGARDPIEYNGTRQIKHILMGLLGGEVPLYVFQDDGGVFSDQTANASDPDVDCVLLSNAPQVGDAVYFGNGDPFDHLSFDVNNPGTAQNVVWEYWNGSTWAALSNVVDNTNHFTTSGINIVSWDHPGTGWADTTVNGQLAKYVRARVTLSGSGGANTTAAFIVLDMDYGVALDSVVGTTNLDFMPEFSSDYQVDNVRLVRELLELTTAAVVLKNDGFHIKFVDKDKPVVDYTYDSNHLVYQDIFENNDVLPNQWYVASHDQGISDVSFFNGSASHAASIAKWGTYTAMIVDGGVTSNAEAITIAEKMRDRALFNIVGGVAIAPMNCGQEIWDVAQVNNQWTADNNKGIVTHIIREYRPGVYQIELTFGGYISIVDRPSEAIIAGETEQQLRAMEQQRGFSEALTDQQKELSRLFDLQTITVLNQIRQERSQEAFNIQLEAERVLAESRLSPGAQEVLDVARQIQLLNILLQQTGNLDPARQTPTTLETLLRLTGAITGGPDSTDARISGRPITPFNAPLLGPEDE